MMTKDKKVLGILSTIILAGGSLAGCVAYAQPGQVGVEVAVPDPVIAVGFYEPDMGYWTGTDWDLNFYDSGHPGYGHPHYSGAKYVTRGHERDHFENRGHPHGDHEHTH